VSVQIVHEFYQYMRESSSSEKHMTNALIMTVVNDSMEEKVIETIRKNSNVHGKIFVSELKDAIDLTSGQRGESVLQK
jgi:nitrogen regulatory protein PII